MGEEKRKTVDPGEVDFRQMFSLEGRLVVLSGACGLIGRAFAEACAQFGAAVVVADLPGTDPARIAGDLSQRHGREMMGFDVDVTDGRSVEDLRDAVVERYGRIDGLVNAHQNKTAGFFAALEDYSDADWDDVVDTNLKGTYLTCRAIGGWMARNGGGSIVNLASTYSVVAPNQRLYRGTEMGCPAAYSASKGGVQALSQYLATYWADKGVRVNLLTPHGVWNHHEEQFESNFAELSPLQRMSLNHEVAGALIYLISDASSYVVGHNLVVDGGWTAW